MFRVLEKLLPGVRGSTGCFNVLWVANLLIDYSVVYCRIFLRTF